MFIALFAILWPQAKLSAEDFFALKPGTIRTFSDTNGEITTDEVLAPISIDGKPATPVVQRSGAKIIDTIYYRVEPSVIFLLGYDDPKHLLPTPMPILMYDGKGGNWKYVGESAAGKSSEAVTLQGQCRGTREQEVLGKRVPTLEVSLDATMGQGFAQEHSQQTARYAAGIGMFELTTVTRMGKQRSAPKIRRLNSIEEAKPTG